MSAIVPIASLFLFAIAVLIGVRQMALILMLFRPACDRIFDIIKISTGQQMGPGAVLNYLVILLAVIAIAHVPYILLTPIIFAWGAFLVAAIASLLQSSDASIGLRLFATLVTYGAAFCLPYALVRGRQQAILFLKIALYSSAIPFAWSFVDLATAPSLVSEDYRLQSTFNHPNILAFYLVGVIALILFLLSSSMSKTSPSARRLYLAYAGLLTVLLLFTKTRSAWISMAFIVIGYAVLVDRRWLFSLLCLPFALLIPGVSDRIFELNSGNIDAGYAQLNSYAWRKLLWTDTGEWMHANPSLIFGNGLDSYASLAPLFFQKADQAGGGIGAHNTLLQIYFEMGLFGIATFFMIFAALFYVLLAHLKNDYAGSIVMMLNCVGYLIVCISDNLLDYLQYQWFFWFSVGTVCATKELSPRKVDEISRRY